VDKSHLEIVKIGDKEFSLYTHSFLNYGLESAQSLFIEKLQSSGSAFEKPQNPCYPAGVEYQGTVGTGNYDSCFALLDKIFDKKACQVKSCSFNGVYQPKVTNEQFYAIENFFYTPEFFETLKSDTPISALLEKGKKFCKNSWIDVVKTYASEKEPEDQLKKYCFSSAYIPKILSEGFGIANPDKSIKVAKKIKDSSIDWSLGSVIHDVVNNPALLPSKSNEEDVRIHSVNAGYSLESVILLLIFSVIGVVFFQRFMSKRNGPGRSNSKIISLSRVSLSNS
jgi:apyrase